MFKKAALYHLHETPTPAPIRPLTPLLPSLFPGFEVLQRADIPFSIQKCDAQGGLEGI